MTWLDALFPMRCAGCDALCTDRLCERCGWADPFDVEDPPEGLRWVLAVASYDGGAAAALRRAKYAPDRAVARFLGRWMAHHTAAAAVGFDWLVPVPSPWSRRAARGFACSSVFARELSRASEVPVASILSLDRGVRQAGLGRRARSSNLRGRLRSIAAAPGRVLLVDDVLTTGTTLGAAARELLGDATSDVAAIVLCAATGLDSPPPAAPASRVNR
jgi:predicted amidophosphoribosyltransferase